MIPSIWEQGTFVDKGGPQILGQMYTFEDKKQRPCCLIPEVTAIVQEQWRESWSKNTAAPYRMFYVSRCYRYERPQKGRYREFTQLGVEILGGDPEETKAEAVELLKGMLDELEISYQFVGSVQRGLSYYIEDGFEVECETLGAQKQVAGGGRYDEGVGWAVGVDRLVLALE